MHEINALFSKSPGSVKGSSRDLARRLSEHGGVGPGFHFLRHLLSVVILAHHCRIAVIGSEAPTERLYDKGAALTGSAVSTLTHGQMLVELLRPGLFALVGMFFALSGFLIVGSALRTARIGPFLVNRCLRIAPALAVEVTLCALVFGPFFTTLPLDQYFADPQFLRYFGNIVGHVTMELPGVFNANPWPSIVNANLWTLPAEFWCYLVMIAMMAAGVLAAPARLTLAILVVAGLALGLGLYDPIRFTVRDDSTHFTSWYIVMMFFFGVALHLNAARIAMNVWLFLLCAAAYYVLTLLDRLGVVSGMLLTYCVIYLGMQRFPWFDRRLRKDLSYGIYLYGFPITQAVVLVLLPHLRGLPSGLCLAVIFPTVLILTGSFASLSWDYIEKPALSLRRLVLRRPGAEAATA